MSSRALKARNELGVACRHHPERETEARRNLAEAKIADQIEKVLSEAPPLSDPTSEVGRHISGSRGANALVGGS